MPTGAIRNLKEGYQRLREQIQPGTSDQEIFGKLTQLLSETLEYSSPLKNGYQGNIVPNTYHLLSKEMGPIENFNPNYNI